MASRKRMMWTSVAIVATLMISVPSLSSAQAQGAAPAAGAQAPAQGARSWSRRGAPPYTPAAGAKDLKSVLFNWAWHTGMLRSDQEYDLIMTLAYSGKGTMQVGGQPCNVTMYRSDINYKMSGERIRITGTRPNGQSCSTIEVISGAYTWNEDIHGCRARPGQGQSHADGGNRRGADDSPVGRPAGCVQGRIRRDDGSTANDPQAAAAGSRCDDDRQDVRRMGRQQAGVDVPDPGRPHCHGDRHARREVHGRERRGENGANTYEFTYSDYKDWNNPLNPAEALYAGRMTEKKNGTVVRDITTTVTETGQMYVTIPVPASIKAAIKPTHSASQLDSPLRHPQRPRRRQRPSRRGAPMGSRT